MEIKKILQTAVNYKASDVYISQGIKPFLRINGKLHEIAQHEKVDKGLIESYIKELLSKEQINKFANSRDYDLAIEIKDLGRFRVNLFCQKNGYGIVLRNIPEEILSIDQLNLPNQIKKIAELKQGIVLVTGPTGQGKSTTMAAIINEINENKKYNIITIEDPIEFVYKNKSSIIQQREIGTHTNNFQTALKSALRESCDVILIGEMRDPETIQLALTAAETGHLVISTLHTSGAAKTIDRIIDSFETNKQNQIRNQISESLRTVIWQQLLPSIDGKSRVAALEIMNKNEAIGNLIRKNKTFQIASVIETNVQKGMVSMKKSIENHLATGFISSDVAEKYIQGLGLN